MSGGTLILRLGPRRGMAAKNGPSAGEESGSPSGGARPRRINTAADVAAVKRRLTQPELMRGFHTASAVRLIVAASLVIFGSWLAAVGAVWTTIAGVIGGLIGVGIVVLGLWTFVTHQAWQREQLDIIERNLVLHPSRRCEEA